MFLTFWEALAIFNGNDGFAIVIAKTIVVRRKLCLTFRSGNPAK